MKSLPKSFDRTFAPNKILGNILRKYLTASLAMQFTAVKRMPNKCLLRETLFYDCLYGMYFKIIR